MKHAEAIRAAVEERAESWNEPTEFWEKFLKQYHKADIARMLVGTSSDTTITIDIKKVHDNKMWEHVVSVPMGASTEDIQSTLAEMLHTSNPQKNYKSENIVVRFINVPKRRKIRDLRVSDINDLIGIKCLVKRITEVRPKIVEAQFRCAAGHFTTVKGGFNAVKQPDSCATDGCTYRTLTHVGARDKLVNRQFVYIQEPLDELRAGGQPSTLKVELIGDLCNTIMVGDRLVLNGAYRAIDKAKGLAIDSTKEVYFDCNNAEIGEREFEDVTVTDADIEEIKKLGAMDDIYTRLTESIAPSILGMSLLKQAIVLMLFEGVTKKLPDGTPMLGCVNVLCISDPGMAKTVLLKFVTKVAPRGVYVDCTNATKVGLVAPVIKDETTGQWAVEAGAYMLASGGVLCADELSELGGEGFKSLHEAMADGEVHVTKAGLNVTVKTTASMLGACNPKKGRFSIAEALPEQVGIPPAILSRFDLVLLLQDIPNKERDARIAKHITDTHMAAGMIMNGETPDDELSSVVTPPVASEMLRKYVAYARKINPVLRKEAAVMLNEYYVNIRPFTDTGETVAVTTRQQPAVVRLAEAHARMRLSKNVEKQDAEAAIELFDRALRCIATDPVTGKIDSDRVSNTSNAQSRNMQDTLMRTIMKIGGDTKTAVETRVFDEMQSQGHDPFRVRRLIDDLLRAGTLTAPRNGLIRIM